MNRKRLDISVGVAVGSWRVLAETTMSSGNKTIKAMLCMCSCGARAVVRAGNLAAGRSRQCKSCSARKGAAACAEAKRKKSGLKSGHWLYSTYSQMIYRCHSGRGRDYRDYGARGISVCDRWRGDFWAFVADMAGTYKKGLSLDRIDNDAGYSKENCRWATPRMQSCNTRVTNPADGKAPGLHRRVPKIGNPIWVATISMDGKVRSMTKSVVKYGEEEARLAVASWLAEMRATRDEWLIRAGCDD